MSLQYLPSLDRLDLVAKPVEQFLKSESTIASMLDVAEIDPTLADTAACCERYGLAMEDSANCVIIAGKRGEIVKYAACVVLATTRADVNGVVRKYLDARKASFAPMEDAVALSGMEFGGITPFGLPEDWPVLVDSRVIGSERAVFGSGLRKSKLFGPGSALEKLSTVETIEGLANPA